MLSVLLGGARSGKSALAVRMAQSSAAPVFYIATGEAGDEEMAARIADHRAQRPPAWTTVEEPRDLARALVIVPPRSSVILDCLTLWVSNVFHRDDADVLDLAREAALLASRRDGRTIVVTNEVGSGIVPMQPESRRYRDLLGTVNSIWVEACDEALLVVAGRAVRLRPPEELLGG